MLERVWRKQNPLTLLVGMQISTATMENSVEIPFFFLFYFIFKLYIIALVLPNIKMNPPQAYMRSPSRTLLPPHSPYHPSGSSHCTSPKHPVSLGEWRWNMYNIIYETNCQSRFDARYWMLGAGAMGQPRGMEWGGRREEGSGWGTHVYLWRIHFDIWQN